ncbi:MAG: hypothetical protein V3V08_17585 [Nannocystaceae bacterium]
MPPANDDGADDDDDDDDDDVGTFEVHAVLSVEAGPAEGEWTLTFDNADRTARLGLAVHSAGRLPLGAALDELDATIRVGAARRPGRASLEISDTEGLVYVVLLDAVKAREPNSAGFVGFGDRLAKENNGAYRTTFRTAKYDTDDGLVEVEPGERRKLQLGGRTYSVVLADAYTNKLRAGRATPKCGMPTAVVAMELLWTRDDAEGELAALESDPSPLASCGD